MAPHQYIFIVRLADEYFDVVVSNRQFAGALLQGCLARYSEVRNHPFDPSFRNLSIPYNLTFNIPLGGCLSGTASGYLHHRRHFVLFLGQFFSIQSSLRVIHFRYSFPNRDYSAPILISS